MRNELRGLDRLKDWFRKDDGEKGLALLKRAELETALQTDAHPRGLCDDLLRLTPGALDCDAGVFDRIRMLGADSVDGVTVGVPPVPRGHLVGGWMPWQKKMTYLTSSSVKVNLAPANSPVLTLSQVTL